nr:uncharacterized protein LOC129166525 [Nothobranchius furzeri]
MIFTKKMNVVVNLKWYGENLEQVKSFNYLGVIFDTRLTWKENISNIEERCRKVINIMRCLKGTDWGYSAQALKQIYISMIRSVIDYGSIMYGSSSKTLLKRIESIQNQALRICSGAIKSTPVASLQVEMGEMPICLRFKQILLNYWTSLQGCTEEQHLVKKDVFLCWENGNEKYESVIEKANRLAEIFKLNDITFVKKCLYSVTPKWIFPHFNIDFHIKIKMEQNKGKGNWDNIVDRLDSIHKTFIPIFTDGSKDSGNEGTGFSFCIPVLEKCIKFRTSNSLSVFTVLAISFSLRWIEQNIIKKCIICTDSLSALMSIKPL